MALDFDVRRVNNLFKDEERTELKEGITVRDINSVVGMTPVAREDLHEVLQNAYALIRDNAYNQLEKYNSSTTNLMTPTNSLGGASLDYNFKLPSKTLAQQMEEQKIYVANKENPPLVEQSAYDSLENKIKDKDKVIELLTKERDEALNSLDELENHHQERYKELNNKYEELRDSKKSVETVSPGIIEEISDDLLEYLKDRIIRIEQKNDLLNQEVGKLKGMLGI